MTIGVLLVDDQELMRMGFRMVIDSQRDMSVVGEAGDGRQAVARVKSTGPDVVLMDVRMPVLDGVEATRLIVAGDDRVRVIILTTFDLDEYVYAGLRAGASGFLLKDSPPAELLAAIRTVAAGDAVVDPRVTRRLLTSFAHRLPVAGRVRPKHADRLSALTEREREVHQLVAGGLSNNEIAERLVLSEATVKTHVGRILAKLELRGRVQIVIFAYEAGLVAPASG